MDLKVTINTSALKQRLGDVVERQLPFAIARALTQTAKEAQAAVRREMVGVFDRPTSYTLNSTFVRPATKTRLAARVWLKDEAAKSIAPAKYLLPQIMGGGRRQKRSEVLLSTAGILPPGWYLVPSKHAPLDSAGNVPRSVVQQILSDLRAHTDVGFKSNRITKAEVQLRNEFYRAQGSRKRARMRESRFFVVQPGGKAQPGIYQKINSAFGRAAKPVFIFTAQPQYAPRLNFFGVVERVMRANIEANFEASLADALRTAR